MNKIDFTKVKKAFPYSALIIFFVALILSFIIYLVKRPGDRYVFYFDSLDSKKVCTETRYLPSNPPVSKINSFVDDLLLGPMTNRYLPLFNKDTHKTFCFVEGKTLSVGISKEALQISSQTADIYRGMKLFKQNILKNFNNINTVDLYIDGVYVEEEGQ